MEIKYLSVSNCDSEYDHMFVLFKIRHESFKIYKYMFN